MDYSKYAPATKKTIHIQGNLIEFDKDTWQIKNLIRISLQETKIPFEIPKPTFDEATPQKKMNLIPALGTFAGGIFLSITFLSIWIYLLAIAASAGIIFRSLKNSKIKLDQWSERQEKHEKRLEIWNDMEKNPQVIYAISIEPNPSQSPLFYSHDKNTCNDILRTIKQAMATRSDEVFIDYNINAIKVKNDTKIVEVGAAVYKKIAAEFFEA